MTTHKPKNILFIMIDQLRWDCLSCYGHPVVETPNIDRVAARGVRFTQAYTQGTSCGNSRASFYTGRHVRSHGATWNDWPFHVGEWTLADYMRPSGVEVLLLGKTHMKPDLDGMHRLGIDAASELGRYLSNAGFTQGEHDDGLHPEGPLGRYAKKEPRYNDYLREQGFDGSNPWLQWANAAVDESNVVRSGFHMEHAHRAARIPAELSETAYLTNRAIETIDALDGKPWCLHLSYIKPHWPYMASAPYNSLYRGMDLPPVVRSQAEQHNPHPVYREFMQLGVAQCWRDETRRAHVMPTYLGLVKQLDDELGRLFAHLQEKGLDKDTLIAITADHGDYFGDHWLGEKDLFHDPAAKIPLIIMDPSAAADGTRGQTCDALTGAIDLLPTFVESLGLSVPEHRLEGRSLVPLLQGASQTRARDIIVSEADYGRLPVAAALGRDPYNARMTMAFDSRYKYVHCPGFRPMLFDLHNDPGELHDLGADPGYAAERGRLQEQLLDWSSNLRNRTAVNAQMYQDNMGKSLRQGIIPGFWRAEDVPEFRRIPKQAGVF
jgi:arylsulfatase A-like enzyme